MKNQKSHLELRNQTHSPKSEPRRLATTALGFLLAVFCVSARAQGTAFTYQGRLTDGTNAASGFYDFRAQIYNRAVAGEPGDALVSSTLTLTAVPVTNGLFVLNLDFGANPFNGEPRWLLLAVRTNAALNYTTLVPRQPVTPTPYAILSGSLSGPLPAAQLTGTVSAATLPTGGNWALNSTLTLDWSTLSIDPVNNRVGIGTATPGWPLHQVAAQGVVRVDSTASAFGSVLELRNNTASPTYLGAINFNNAAATFPGQIGYLGDDTLSFRTAGAERMKLAADGRLSVFGSATRGVYAEATATAGIGVFGFAGPSGAASAGNGNTGVFGESAQNNGNGVVGVANTGSSAFGVWGKSTAGRGGVFDGGIYGIYATSSSGTAGYFNNLTVVECNSAVSKPHLRLHETQDGDYARLEFQAASRPYWHIAVGGGAVNQMNFYNSTNGDVMTLKEDGNLFVKVLTITGGADIAEPFQMSQRDLPKGAVVVIDEEHPGHLKLSTEPYDRRVAGIISGAGGVNPGVSLSQQGVVEGDQPIALTGRVYVRADTSNGPIRPGDLLTTSATPGYAMRVSDHAQAQGAILGKAMTSLQEGKGLVLVLVALQ